MQRILIAVVVVGLLVIAAFYAGRGRITGRGTGVEAPTVTSEPVGTVLFVGNSFVRGVKRPLRALFRSTGQRVRVATVAPAGWTLARHAATRRTQAKILSRPWDYVVLQDQSAGIWSSRYPAARALNDTINANGSSTIFFMTWRDRGEPMEAYDDLKGEPGGTTGYLPIAYELGAMVAPVGWAVRTLVAEGTPIDVWARDGHHLAKAGEYLAACVTFATITGSSPVGLWAPGQLNASQALYLQELAEQVAVSGGVASQPDG